MSDRVNGYSSGESEVDSVVTTVFYDGYNRHMTVAVDSIDQVMMVNEDDGSVLFSFEAVEDIEFFWPDEKIWRPVK